MRFITSLLIIAFLFMQAITPATAVAQTVNPFQKQVAEFETFVKSQMTVDKIPGLSIGFIKDDVVWTKGFGYADLENKTPMKAESMYRMASVTKPMTATAILQLVEKGKIDLDAEVQTYVPYFPKKKFPVTVRLLLGHIGGLSHYHNYDDEGHFKTHKTTRESIAVFENFDLVAEPGTRFNYSSYGYNLLGAVIEGATGQAYGDYMRENVWKPLGMNDIRMDDPTELIANRVRGYDNVGGKIQNSEFVDISSRFSAGGTRSTVLDMLKFGKGVTEGKVLSKASLDLMFNSMALKNGDLTGYSAGWGVSVTNGRFTLSHSGGQQETSTFLYTFPGRRLTIAIASNLEGANTAVYVQKLFEALTGEAWNTNAYINNDRHKVPLYLGLVGVFEEGRAAFEKSGQPFSNNPQDLTTAFTYFDQNLNNETLQASSQLIAFRKVREGRQPPAGQPFARMGSYMVAKLKEKLGAERVFSYSNTGAITFFHDYIELYRKDSSIPKEFRFNETVEKTIADWQASWSKTNTVEARKLVISPGSNFDELGADLKKRFAGATVFPNYGEDLNAAARYLATNGQGAKALKVSEISAEVYPGLDSSNAHYGIMLVLSGDKEKGKTYLRRANELNGGGMASANGLNTTAGNLAGTGLIDEGMKLLEVAIELYPQNASLYDSIGEFYMRKGIKDKAIESYKKALAINPNYPSAENARARLKKLEN